LQLQSEDALERFPLIARDIETILQDQGLKATFLGHNIDLHEQTNYYFKEIPRISQFQWNPSLEDILHLRENSQGMEDVKFEFDKNCYRLLDVYAHGDMDKWIHQFEDASAILFCVDISRYDEFIDEKYKYTDNPVRGALNDLSELTHTEWFMQTPVIILFTNTKLFSEKLPKKKIYLVHFQIIMEVQIIKLQ